MTWSLTCEMVNTGSRAFAFNDSAMNVFQWVEGGAMFGSTDVPSGLVALVP